jgi:hypothetical protein
MEAVMVRSLAVLALVSTCVTACSQPQTNPPASGTAEQMQSPGASSSAPASQPAAAPETTTAARAPSHPADSPTAAPVRPSNIGAAPSAAAPSAAAEPAAPAAPPAPPVPQFKDVTIPAGTTLNVKLLSNLASNTSHIEDAVKGSITRPVVVDGTTALPDGTSISGSVTQVSESGRVKGRASIGFKFDRLSVGSETHRIQTATVTREAAADKKSDVKKGGIGAGLGAVVGGVIGGGKGAAIGAVAGGAGTVMATKGDEIELPAGTVVTVHLQEPLTVTVPLK